MPDNKDRRGRLYDALKQAHPDIIDVDRDVFVKNFSDTSKLSKLYNVLKDSGSEVIDVDENTFKNSFGDINPNPNKPRIGVLKNPAQQKATGLSVDDFSADKVLEQKRAEEALIYQKKQSIPAADYQRKVDAPQVSVAIQSTINGNTEADRFIAEVDGNKFDSDRAVKVGRSDIKGSDIYEIELDGGTKGLVTRKDRSGTYEWYKPEDKAADDQKADLIERTNVANQSKQYEDLVKEFGTDDPVEINRKIELHNAYVDSQNRPGIHERTSIVGVGQKIAPLDLNSEFVAKINNKRSNRYWSEKIPQLEKELVSAKPEDRADIKAQIDKAELEIKRTNYDAKDLSTDLNEVAKAMTMASDPNSAPAGAVALEKIDKSTERITDAELVNKGEALSKSDYESKAKEDMAQGNVLSWLYDSYKAATSTDRTYKGSEGDVTVQKYTAQLSATAKENTNLSRGADLINDVLDKKYQGKWGQFKKDMEEKIPDLIDQYESAKEKNDVNLANAKAKEISALQAQYDDIRNDPYYKKYTDVFGRIKTNQEYMFNIEKDAKWQNAKAIIAAAKKAKEEEEQRFYESEKQWNSGNKFTASWNQGGMLAETVPMTVVNAIGKIPTAAIDIVDAFGSMIDEDGKVDSLMGVKNWAHGKFEDQKMDNPIASGIEGSTLYMLSTTMADLLPQAAVAWATGGLATAIGASAKTAQIVGGVMSNMGIAYHDQYEANLAIMPEDMSDADKRRYAATLAFGQTAAVGIAGEFLGGSLGMLTGNKGFFDDLLDLDMFSGFSKKELRDIVKREAHLLAEGRAKEFMQNTTGGMLDKLKSAYMLAKAGTRAATVNGAKETIEENVTEPLSQKIFEFGYKLAGGEGDLQKADHEADNTQYSNPWQAFIVPFAMGMITKGVGMATESEKSTYMNGLEIALKNPEAFAIEMANYKAKGMEKFKDSPADLKTFQQAIEKVEADVVGITGKFEGLKEKTPEHLHGRLIELLREKADAERKVTLLTPSKESLAADKAHNDALQKNEKGELVGERKNGLKAYVEAQQEVLALDAAIDKVASPEKAGGLIGLAGSWIDKYKENKKKKGSTDTVETAKSRVEEAKGKLSKGALTLDDLQGTTFFENLSDDKKNEIQAMLESDTESKWTQEMLFKELEKDIMSKTTEASRKAANQMPIDSDTLEHNISLRSSKKEGTSALKTDDNNIAFNKNSSYAYASKEDADAIKAGGDAKLKYNKGVSKGEKNNFVVEKATDRNGNEVRRVYEKQTDGSYEVVHDEIGTRSTIDEKGMRQIKNERHTKAQVAVDRKREEIIKRVNPGFVDGKRDLDRAATEKALLEDKEYQSLVSKANDANPSKSIFGGIMDTFKQEKEKMSLQKRNEAMEKVVDSKVKSMMSNKDKSVVVTKEDC